MDERREAGTQRRVRRDRGAEGAEKKRGADRGRPLHVGGKNLLPGWDEMASAVLLPAGFVGFGAEGLFLAVTDGVEVGGRNAEIDEVLFDGVGAAIAEGEVVFGGAAFIAMAFDIDLFIRIALEE